MTEATVVHVTMWDSPYLGNFMHAQFALAELVWERFGLRTHFVLASGASDVPWLGELEARGLGFSVPPAGAQALDAHLRDLLATSTPALVHTHFTTGDLAGARAAHRAGVPCVWHVHTGFEGYPAAQRAKDLLKMRIVARRRVARIITVSTWLEQLVRRRGGPASKIVAIPNAIVVGRFEALLPKADARKLFGVPDDGPLVLALAWWPEAKGADVLLDALELLAAEGRPVNALLVGEERLRELVAARGLGDAPWLTISGFVADPAQLFAAADLFVSSSRHEGAPYALGEALACDLPVVTTDIPGVAGYLGAPGVSTVPSVDPRALADAIAARTAPSAPAEEPGAARAWVDRELGLDTWCRRVADVYAELL